MSKTIRGAKGPGYEYWGSRHPTLMEPGRYTKQQTHRHERRQGKRECELGGRRVREDCVETDADGTVLFTLHVRATAVAD